MYDVCFFLPFVYLRIPVCQMTKNSYDVPNQDPNEARACCVRRRFVFFWKSQLIQCGNSIPQRLLFIVFILLFCNVLYIFDMRITHPHTHIYIYIYIHWSKLLQFVFLMGLEKPTWKLDDLEMNARWWMVPSWVHTARYWHHHLDSFTTAKGPKPGMDNKGDEKIFRCRSCIISYLYVDRYDLYKQMYWT